MNPPESDRLYSGYYGYPNDAAFAQSTLGHHRLWRLSSDNPSAYAHWAQLSLGAAPATVSGVAITPGAIWSGAMFTPKFNVRACSVVNQTSG